MESKFSEIDPVVKKIICDDAVAYVAGYVAEKAKAREYPDSVLRALIGLDGKWLADVADEIGEEQFSEATAAFLESRPDLSESDLVDAGAL